MNVLNKILVAMALSLSLSTSFAGVPEDLADGVALETVVQNAVDGGMTLKEAMLAVIAADPALAASVAAIAAKMNPAQAVSLATAAATAAPGDAAEIAQAVIAVVPSSETAVLAATSDISAGKNPNSATPAEPAIPGEPGTPAIPAIPAIPASGGLASPN